ncbi:MAG TPA: YbhB/YbcL family Raf kinase inhibitor-like protein [Bacteroidota bacterium]
MKLICPALFSETYLPARCMHPDVPGGHNISPPLLWGEIPAGTASLVLTMTDLDGPAPDYVLWFIANIPPSARALAEKASADRHFLPPGTVEYRNALGELRYSGPVVPRGGDEHRIEFRLWALELPRLMAGPFAAHAERAAALARAALDSAVLLARATRSS